jgi:hypothetical protein
MAAYTINDTDARKHIRFLEAITATNAAADKTRAVKVPADARFLSVYLFITSQGGTTPTFDFSLIVPDFGTAAKLSAPTDDNPATLVSLTQVTGTGPYQQRIDIGPGVTGIADDTTGAAAGDAVESVNAILPPWLVYTIDTDVTTGDEDFSLNLVFVFRP